MVDVAVAGVGLTFKLGGAVRDAAELREESTRIGRHDPAEGSLILIF